MKPYCTVCLFIALSLLWGCRSTTETTVRPLDMAETVTSLSRYIGSIQLIPLEEEEESMLTYPTKMFVLSDGTLILKDSGGKVQKYDANGKYAGRIGMRGRGHGEYSKLQDICIEPETDNICVLDIGKIVRYDSKLGTFVSSIEIPRHNYDEFCSDRKGGFWLFAAAPDYDSFTFDEPFMMLHRISSHGGKPVQEMLSRNDYVMNVSLISLSYDGTSLLRPLEGENILYSLGEIAQPIVQFDFGEKKVPSFFMINDGMPDYPRYLFSDYYKNFLYVHNTERDIFFTVIGPNATAHNYLLSSDYSRGITWKDNPDIETPSIVMASTSEFYYVMVFDIKQYMDLADEELSPLDREIVKTVKDSNCICNSNPLIVKISFIL